jgi:hypothetical protein
MARGWMRWVNIPVSLSSDPLLDVEPLNPRKDSAHEKIWSVGHRSLLFDELLDLIELRPIEANEIRGRPPT